MIRIASLIEQFGGDFLRAYGNQLLPSQRKTLAAMKMCRTKYSRMMKVHCHHCDEDSFLPHSCGNRHCPHCQHHESQQWLENQCRKQLPVPYFLVTFTLPRALRKIGYQQQRRVYTLMFRCVWDTLKIFSQNDKQLQGIPGVIAVLHTHARNLDYHPHIHVLIPAAAINKKQRLWREKKSPYLFSHKALAKVFRAKLLEALVEHKVAIPGNLPKEWVVDVKSVGRGDKTLVYLGRYLYRGVIREKDILACENGQVTFRYVDGKTKQTRTRTLSGMAFLWLIMQHVLPRGFRRARNYGFLHPNSKVLIRILQHILPVFCTQQFQRKKRPRPAFICKHCSGEMEIIKTRISLVCRQKLVPE